jgi:hypothetical protein
MFSNVWIGVTFQLKPQFTFCYTAISVKLGFMEVTFSTAPSRGLVAKSRLRWSTHPLLQIGQLTHLPLDAQSS